MSSMKRCMKTSLIEVARCYDLAFPHSLRRNSPAHVKPADGDK
jgi:hypothetical protein